MHRHDHGLRFATSVQLPLIDTGRIRLSVYGRRSRSAAMWLIGGPDSPKHIIGPQWALAAAPMSDQQEIEPMPSTRMAFSEV